LTEPRVTVVVPCAGDLVHLEALADSLAPQIDGDVEVVLVDNHVSDAGSGRLAAAAAALGPARIVAEEQPGIGPARNAGAAAARGGVLAFVDADDVTSREWVAGLTATVSPGVVAAGRLEYDRLNPAWLVATRGRQPRDGPYVCEGLFPVAPGGNLAITRADFDDVGGFAADDRSLEDFDLGLRVWDAGMTVRLADARATLHYRLRDSPPVLYRQGARYGAARAAMWAELHRRGLVRRWARPGWRSWLVLLLSLPGAVVSRQRRCMAAWVLGNRVGRVTASIRHRVLYV